MSHVRDELLTRVEGLKLASYCNPLDALKKKFKRYGVSELTGLAFRALVVRFCWNPANLRILLCTHRPPKSLG